MRSRPMYVAICWNNPYTEPPDGGDRVLAWGKAYSCDEEQAMKYLLIKVTGVTPQCGYGVRIIPDPLEPHRFLDGEQLASRRYNTVRNRLRRKYTLPGLAEEALQKDMERRPLYYDPEACERHQQFKRDAEEQYFKGLHEVYSPEKEVKILETAV